MTRTAFLLSAMMAFVFATPSIGSEKTKITIPTVGNGFEYYPVYIARAAGYFDEEGLEVDWISVNGGTRQAAAVMGGSAEMAPLGLLHVIRSQSQGGTLVAFATVFNTLAMPLVLSPKAIEKAGITQQMSTDEKVKRLSGLRIAISSPGSATDAVVRSLFLSRGLNPDKEVQIQPFGTGASILAAFEKGLSDGFVFPSPAGELAVVKGLGKIVIDPVKREVPELIDVPHTVLATTRETWEKKPKVIEAAMRAMFKASALARAEPEKVKALVRQYFPELDDAVYAEAATANLKAVPGDPTVTESEIEHTVKWMNLVGSKPISVSYSSAVLSEPARNAKK